MKYLVFLSALFAGSLADADEIWADCASYQNHEPCVLAWSQAGSKSQDLMLQRWDRHSAEWINQKKLPKKRPRKSLELDEGRLYRVLSCRKQGAECSSSNAFWAPVWADPEDIPDAVDIERDGEVASFEIDRDDGRGNAYGPAFQVTQYNMYLIDRELVGLKYTIENMPPMSLPVMEGEAPVSLEEQVLYNVFDIYEATRLELENFRKTGTINR